MARSAGSVARQEDGSGPLLLDFSLPSVADDFVGVDDRIMGGASTSRVSSLEGCCAFEGELIVEGGGFASVRFNPPFVLPSDVEALLLEARGDGREGYKLTLRSSAADASISYQFLLPPLDSREFVKIRLPLSEFRASIRGRPCPEAPPLLARDVRSLGLMLSRFEAGGGEKTAIPAGKFRLELKRLSVAESELAMNGRRWVSPK
ncbi:MAG: hypothetical protein SGPRY_007912 [Prymnesium sp.]